MTCRLHWCDRGCYGRSDLCRRHDQQAKAGEDLSSPPSCAECNVSMLSASLKRRFCSVACRMKFYRHSGCYTKDALLKAVGTCKLDGCDEPVRARGFCNSHNLRFLRHGDPMGGNWKIEGCKSPGCDKPHESGGFCHKHYHLDYYYRNRDKRRSYLNARRTYMKTATPAWADLAEIERIYAQCPEGHHVDHVVPLRGRNVCGLHCEANLAYLPAHENQRKSNRWMGVAGPNRRAAAC